MKKMKLVSTVCAMALAACFCFTGCGKDSDAGRYNFYSMTEDGETITMKDMEEMYKEANMEVPEMYLELKDDGTGTLVLGEDDTETVKWKDGVITADGEDVEYTVQDNKLTLKIDGDEMVFEKAE